MLESIDNSCIDVGMRISQGKLIPGLVALCDTKYGLWNQLLESDLETFF